MTSVAKTEIIIKATDRFSGNLGKMSATVDRFNASVGTMGRAGAALGASFASFASISNVIDGIGNLIGNGIKLNVAIENAQVGMSGVLLSMTKINDRQLKWNEAMMVSKDIIQDLTKAAIVTAATPTELINTYSGLLGIGLGRGLSIEELKEFTVTGVNAVKSMGLDGRQLVQELRDLLQGSISSQKSTLATSLGLTSADIKKAQNSAEGLFKFLEKRMLGFQTSAKYFPDTLKGAAAVLQGATELMIAEGMEKPIARVKKLMQDVFKDMLNGEGTDFSEKYTKPMEEFGDCLTESIDGIIKIKEILNPVIKSFTEFVTVAGKGLIGNIHLALVGFIGWKTAQQFIKKVAFETLDVYTEINSVLNQNSKALSESATVAQSAAFAQQQTNQIANISVFDRMNRNMKDFSTVGLNRWLNQEAIISKLNKKLSKTANASRLHAVSVEDKDGFRDEITRFQKQLTTMGLSEEEAIRTTIKLAEAFPKLGGTLKAARKEMTEYVRALNVAKSQNQLSTAMNVHYNAFLGQVQGYEARLNKMGLNAEQRINIQKKLITEYKNRGVEAAYAMMNSINKSVESTEVLNKWNQKLATMQEWAIKLQAGLTSAGIGLSVLGDVVKNDTLAWLGDVATKIGLLTYAVQGLASAFNPVMLAITTVMAYYTLLKDKVMENTKSAGWGDDWLGWYKAQTGTRAEYEKARAEKLKQSIQSTATDKGKDIASRLQNRWQKSDDETAEKKEEKRLSNLQKKWVDIEVLEKDIIARTASITSSPFQAAMASLDKEVEQLKEKMKTAAEGLKANGETEESIAAFTARMQERISTLYQLKTEEIQIAYDVDIHWSKVFKDIRETTYNNTQTMIDGFHELTNEFVNFGQNILTEGGSFFDRFDEMFKNFANSIINTMLKIYLQGLLTKSIMGIFGGGGSGTISLQGSTTSSGTFSIGGTSVLVKLFGFANGGVAKGWSIVGERGAELVNFSNPGRVYTADETRSMLGGKGGIGNVKVEIINNTGTQATATSEVQFDGENYIINVVMNAIDTNKKGIKSMLKGAMA